MMRSLPLPHATGTTRFDFGQAIQSKIQLGLEQIKAAFHGTRRVETVQGVGSCLARQSTFTLATLGYGAEEIVKLRHDAARDACTCPWC